MSPQNGTRRDPYSRVEAQRAALGQGNPAPSDDSKKRPRSSPELELIENPDKAGEEPASKRPKLDLEKRMSLPNKGPGTRLLRLYEPQGQKPTRSIFGHAVNSTHNDAAKEKLLADNKKIRTELQSTKRELADSQAEVALLKMRVDAAPRRGARPEVPQKTRVIPEPVASSSRELEVTKKKLLQVEEELSKSRTQVAELNQLVAKNERQINELLSQLNSLLASASNSNDHRGKAPARDGLSIDVFDNRLDQVSEADIKSAVESLNDSMMSFVTDVIEAAEEIVAGRPSYPTEPFEDGHGPLFYALMQDQLTGDNRGLLLDAAFHDQLNVELHELFFSSDVAPVRIDPSGLVQKVFEQLASQASWTVVQRWRALAAIGLSTPVSDCASSSIHDLASRLVKLLAWAHGLTSSDLESLKSTSILPKLRALFEEAGTLAIRARRDVLSVRMSVVTQNLSSQVYDPRAADLAWPDMGVDKGDEVVGRYRFGLKRLREDGVNSEYLAKPQVTTTALIREASKRSS